MLPAVVRARRPEDEGLDVLPVTLTERKGAPAAVHHVPALQRPLPLRVTALAAVHEAVRLALLEPHGRRELLRDVGRHLVTASPRGLHAADRLDVRGPTTTIAHLHPQDVAVRQWASGLRLDGLGDGEGDARAVIDHAEEKRPEGSRRAGNGAGNGEGLCGIHSGEATPSLGRIVTACAARGARKRLTGRNTPRTVSLSCAFRSGAREWFFVVSGLIMHGGGAAKVSGAYEAEWNLFCMLDVLAGLASSMLIEVPGSAGVGFEFWIRRPTAREWHQVKAQNSNRSRWTLAELRKADVLKNFRDKLAADRDDLCVFVSAHSSAPFSRLCAHASHAPDLAAMLGTFMPTADMRDAFEKLRETYWQIGDDETTWRWLRRIIVRTIDHQLLTQFVDERLATLVDAQPATARVALERVMEATLHNPVTTNELRRLMEQHACPRRVMTVPGGTLSGAIRERALAFRDLRRRGLINGSFIGRPHVAEALEMLSRSRPPRSVLLTGEGGSGKSQVLGEIVSELLAQGLPVMTLDVSELGTQGDAESVGYLLGLPAAPARSLAAAFADRRAVLVVDALDSASSMNDRPIMLLRVVGEVIRQARAHPNVVLLLACRSFDLENDDRLRGLVHGEEPGERLEVARFRVEEVEGAIAAAGIVAALTEPQTEVLRNAYNLRLYVELRGRLPASFSSRQDLEAAYAEELVKR
jgi:hypothetical protein